ADTRYGAYSRTVRRATGGWWPQAPRSPGQSTCGTAQPGWAHAGAPPRRLPGCGTTPTGPQPGEPCGVCRSGWHRSACSRGFPFLCAGAEPPPVGTACRYDERGLITCLVGAHTTDELCICHQCGAAFQLCFKLVFGEVDE